MEYGWLITKDYVNTGIYADDSRKGRTGPCSNKFTAEEIMKKGQFFQMKDDDGEFVYEGYFLGDEGSEDAFSPLDDFGMPDAGATEIWYLNRETGKMEQL